MVPLLEYHDPKPVMQVVSPEVTAPLISLNFFHDRVHPDPFPCFSQFVSDQKAHDSSTVVEHFCFTPSTVISFFCRNMSQSSILFLFTGLGACMKGNLFFLICCPDVQHDIFPQDCFVCSSSFLQGCFPDSHKTCSLLLFVWVLTQA